MQNIIKQSLNDMFDKLLNKALEEKPDLIYKDVGCNYFYFGFSIEKDMKTKNYKLACNYEGTIIVYRTLTSHQKELVSKIFKKWGGDNATNNK